ncbi:transglycosylase domain-containing protein [Deinococcus multiflagellatus]|uniref:transglycosylase domain-containing protein n=1 Tax=Deinococcus multiflagellatus TaxID=1656887 RepID=UPI001CCDD41D|nr:transglycosylase domain-containing protein [Deinococcus multiflagellatus]MBZ9713961.1 penicillin-binding protein [Deinococcus multiflagellatus]
MRFFNGLAVLLLAGAAGAGGLWYTWGRDLPSVSDLDVLEFSGQTRVYDRAGTLVGTLTPSLSSGGSVNRNLLKPSQISPWLQKAVVTSEDRRFYQHSGVDAIGIARGLLKGLLKNDLEGGSSITQQVVKNTLLDDLEGARTAERKFKEAVLAYQLERNFDKGQILNAYLNVIYWGDGGSRDIIGAGGAAHAYFRKSAAELNLAESVYLATIIPAPNRRYKDFKAYRPLMKNLMARMVEDRQITQAEADAAWKTPIYPAGWRLGWNADGTLRSATLERPERLDENLKRLEGAGNYANFSYLQAVEKELLPLIGRKALYGGGRIYTGMSAQAQAAAEQASQDARLPDGATLGIALVRPDSGEVLALVGQKLGGGRPSDWNNATQARRQVGSSVKPLLYTLALEKGWKQSDTVLDAPIRGDYQPMNYNRRWTGRYVTLRYSLDHSLNLPTVRMAQELGLNTFEAKLRDLNLPPPPNAGLPLSIGTLEASPLQMAAAYAAFANGGLYYEPTMVRKVEDARGKVLYTRPAPVAKRVWDTRTAWLGLDMLRGVVNDLSAPQGGLATRARIPGWPVGGKTGTTNDVKDLWFAGVAPGIAGAVWVGKQEGGALPGWATSGDVPTPIWQQAVAGALKDQPVATFGQPDGIEYRVVRQVNMAFRTGEGDDAPVARDGSGAQGGFFGRRSPQPAPQREPEPTPPAPSSTPAAPEPEPAALPEEPQPDPTPLPEEPTAPDPAPQEPDPVAPVGPPPANPGAQPQPAPDPIPAPEPEPLPEPQPSDPALETPENPEPLPADGTQSSGQDTGAPVNELEPLD